MFQVLNMSELSIFVNFHKYDRDDKYANITNMRRDAIMKGFWIFQDFEYARFLHMQALQKVLDMSEYG